MAGLAEVIGVQRQVDARAEVITQRDGAQQLRAGFDFSRSPIASAAGTIAQPGCDSEGACESSVSSACASMPLICAACSALVTMSDPITSACGLPPSVFA
jgi:hypothetical protein